MEWLLFIPLTAIALEDFRYRTLHVGWLGCLGLLAAWQFPVPFSHVAANLCFFGIQYSLLILYFSLKEQRPVQLLDRYIGLGDVLFIVILCLLFRFPNLIVFILSSFFVILLWYGVKRKWKGYTETIPLAGALSICLMLVLLLKMGGFMDMLSDRFL